MSSSNLNEDCLLNEESRVALDEAIEKASSNEEFDHLLGLISSQGTHKYLNYQHSLTGVTPLMVFASKGRVGDISKLLSLGADCHMRACDGSTALDCAKRENKPEVEEIIKKHMEDNSATSMEENKLIEQYMSTANPEIIDVDLLVNLIMKICTESKNGAILVFLPGWQDIDMARESLCSNPFFMDRRKFRVLPLHSKVPMVAQSLVFERPAQGCRKIILATNIAETSVTIDDVVYVINSGRMKEKSYDPCNNVSILQSSWISQASEKQRAGRAGRCQPGYCYHLYSRLRAASFAPFQVPEIKRMPIEELCLQVHLDSICHISSHGVGLTRAGLPAKVPSIRVKPGQAHMSQPL